MSKAQNLIAEICRLDAKYKWNDQKEFMVKDKFFTGYTPLTYDKATGVFSCPQNDGDFHVRFSADDIVDFDVEDRIVSLVE